MVLFSQTFFTLYLDRHSNSSTSPYCATKITVIIVSIRIVRNCLINHSRSHLRPISWPGFNLNSRNGPAIFAGQQLFQIVYQSNRSTHSGRELPFELTETSSPAERILGNCEIRRLKRFLLYLHNTAQPFKFQAALTSHDLSCLHCAPCNYDHFTERR